MPDLRKTYKVFVSSPGGLSRERKIVQETMQSLSNDYERRGIAISTWLWEKESTSEFGDRPQALLTRQLGNFDVYIGIMASHFGTPTGDFGSGTEEEFNNAFTSFKEKAKPRVAFFFKSETIVTTKLSAEMIDQLRRVQEFKEKISLLGLYHEFSEDHQLVNRITTVIADVVERDTPKESVAHLQYTMHSDSLTPQTAISRYFLNDVLNAIDANISNGGESITLADIWIDPSLSVFTEENSANPTFLTNYQYNNLLYDLISSASLMILGGETAGK